ncbi:Sulfotransferase family protein [Limimonas halophila]|uniref:Sulfotransferase family protein n=1 Tax=Limimonas halophila TaxID=1082479 RepID=A0A1G7M7U0_9PROT|nr:sulfotransferase [Limimonas halophila]SDF57868.1 Sulfotransferase family protein [Limimonas halophila]
MDQRYLLIVGSPRSGTTLLTAMLGRHPALAVTNEDKTRAWHNVVGKPVVGVKLCVPNDIELDSSWRTAIRRRLRRIAMYNRHNLGIPGPRMKVKSIYSVRDFQRWPDTQILGILRDPHEAVASIRERGGHGEGEARHRWTRAVEVMHQVMQETPERVRVVDFDRLVREPESTMRGLCSWLDVAYDPAVIGGETPHYRLTGIDPDKAGNRGEARFDHPVFDDTPGLREKYRALVAAAAPGGEAAAA